MAAAVPGDARGALDANVPARSALPSFNALFTVPPLARASARQPQRDGSQLARVCLERQRLDVRLQRAECCKARCLDQFRSKGARREVLRWHVQWGKLSRHQQHETLIRYVQEHAVSAAASRPVEPVEPAAPGQAVGMMAGQQFRLRHMFLKRKVCRRAWSVLTCVSGRLLVLARHYAGAGLLQWPTHRRKSAATVQDAMHGALAVLVAHVRERMPLKRLDMDGVFMPFAHKVQLFRLLQAWYVSSLALAKETSLQTPAAEGPQPLEPLAHRRPRRLPSRCHRGRAQCCCPRRPITKPL